MGSPVIIQHTDVTEKNADELRCGVIANAQYNELDGWYYVDGIIWDEKAQELINKGWSVSCSYDFLAFNDEGGEENNIHYDKEFTQLNFTHLAIVNNPRYERANIVFNSKVNNEDKWITIHPNGEDGKGKHLLLKDGESPKEAIERTYGKGEKSDTKDGKDLYSDENFKENAKRLNEQFGEKPYSEWQKDVQTMLKKYGKTEEDWDNAIGARKDAFKQSDTKDGVNWKNKDYTNVSDDELRKKLYDITKRLDEKYGSFENAPYSEKEEYYFYNNMLNKGYRSKGNNPDTKDKQSDTKDGSKDISKEEHAKIKEQVSKMSDDELVKAHFESQKGYESETPRGGSMTKHEATYGEVAQELKRRTGRSFSIASTESEIKEALSKAKSDSKGDLDIKKTTVKMKSGKEKEIEYVDKVPAGYKKLEGAMTAPLGYTWYHNGKSIIDKDRRTILVKDNKTNNSKEQDMAIIDELKKLIFKVENNKENETMVENEKVDKRKLIDEVAGIMKSAGCDDEDIRTAIGKMEKIGYDDSEASADNKKVKNEADGEDKKEEDKKIDNKEDKKEEDKVGNESEEGKEKTEDLKEEEKKDIDNKCKNSKEESYFDKLNKIYNSAKKIENTSVEYEDKQARLDAGKEYFG